MHNSESFCLVTFFISDCATTTFLFKRLLPQSIQNFLHMQNFLYGSTLALSKFIYNRSENLLISVCVSLICMPLLFVPYFVVKNFLLNMQNG